MQRNTKVNFLIKHNKKIEIVQIEKSSNSDFQNFSNKIKTTLRINPKYKVFFYLESEGLTGSVEFTRELFEEILKHTEEYSLDSIFSLRIYTIENFIFTGNLPSISSVIQPKLPTGTHATVNLADMARIKKAEELKENLEEKNQNKDDDEVDEWADIVETNVDDSGVKTKTISTASCSITIGDPVKLPATTVPTFAPKTETIAEKKPEESKKAAVPDFNTPVSNLQGYVKTEKIAAKLELYEKNGPTGVVEDCKVKIQIEISNIGEDKLDKSFGCYQIKGNAIFDRIPLPVIKPGKVKVITIRPEFDKFSSSGLSFFSLGYEENGQMRYFGDILKVEFEKFKTYARMRFVSDKEAAKALSLAQNNTPGGYSNDVMSSSDLQKLTDFLDSIKYQNFSNKHYGPDIYNKFRDLRRVMPNIKKFSGCELIGKNIIPFNTLLKYAQESQEFKTLMGENDSMTKDEIQKVKQFLDSLNYKALENKKYFGNTFTQWKQIRDKTPYINKTATCELILSNIIPFTLLLKYAGDSTALINMLRQKR